jgi:transposase
VNPYDHLVGQHFARNGVRYTVVKCVGSTAITAYLRDNRIYRVVMRLSDVLDLLEVTEISITVPAMAPKKALPTRQLDRVSGQS